MSLPLSKDVDPCEICREAQSIRAKLLRLRRQRRRDEGKIARLEWEERRVMNTHPRCKRCGILMGEYHTQEDSGNGECTACQTFYWTLARQRARPHVGVIGESD